MKRLIINTATPALMVALTWDHHVIVEYFSVEKRTHGETLMPVIEQLMNQIHWQPSDLEEIIVVEGPGSYTGLRIGVTVAKTLAWTLNIPLYGISTLAALAINSTLYTDQSYVVPMINARREHVYTGLYHLTREHLSLTAEDQYLDIQELLVRLKQNLDEDDPILFMGTDCSIFSERIKAYFPHAVCLFDDLRYSYPKASTLLKLPKSLIFERSCYHAVPRYLKQVEAEETWQSQCHTSLSSDQLVKRWNTHES